MGELLLYLTCDLFDEAEEVLVQFHLLYHLLDLRVRPLALGVSRKQGFRIPSTIVYLHITLVVGFLALILHRLHYVEDVPDH